MTVSCLRPTGYKLMAELTGVGDCDDSSATTYPYRSRKSVTRTMIATGILMKVSGMLPMWAMSPFPAKPNRCVVSLLYLPFRAT
ncbi:MAG: hypothetical protein R2788_26805 [Saprospiraceae bacterium]